MGRAEQIQQIVETISRLQKAVSPAVWQESGLSRAQIGMLYMLSYHQGSSMKSLAEYLDISKSAITQQLEPLVERGLVKRESDARDRRIAVLGLSSEGKQLVKRFTQHKMVGLRTALDNLNDEELATLWKLHQKMAENISSKGRYKIND